MFGEEVDGRNTDPSDLSAKWGNITKPDGTFVDFIPAYQRTGDADFFFQSFCGSYYEPAHKYGADLGFEDDVWLTAEEWNIGRAFAEDRYGEGEPLAHETMGLASVVVDIANETAYTVPALGQTGYEKLMPINPGHEDYVVLVAAGYNHYVEPAPLKIYIGQKDVDENGLAIDYGTANERDSFLARNGLLHGQLYGLALEDSTFDLLGVSNALNAEAQDDYLKDPSAPDSFSGRFYPTSYKWGGFDDSKAVIDTELNLWSSASEQPEGYTYFLGDSKVEHPAVDPDISRTRYVQNMTQEGGLLGFDFANILNEITGNDADGNGLPDFLSVDVTRMLGAFDGALTLKTGGKGVASNGETAAKHIEKDVEKLVSPDGLQWISGPDGDVLILDEDSGNDYGERKMALVIDSEDLSVTDGYFLAQAGGKYNARDLAGASALGGALSSATSAEFSGSWDVSPLVAKDANGNFFTAADLAGTGYQNISNTIDINDKTLIGVVQSRGQSGGAVERNQADAGGQIFQFTLDLPEKAVIDLTDDMSPVYGSVYNPGQAIDLDANGFALSSPVLQLDPRANNSNLSGLAGGLELSLIATRDVHVMDPLGSLTIDAGTNGLFGLSHKQDEITNLGGAGNFITAGVGPDLFVANEPAAGAGLFADLIKDFQLGIDELLVDSAAGLIHFGADAEAADLRSNPLLAGLKFRFTPDLRTASGQLHVIAGQTSLMGAGLRVAKTDASIVSAEILLTHAGSSRLELAGSIPAGLSANLDPNGQRLVVSTTDSALDPKDLHQLLSAVQLSGEHSGSIEVLALDANGLVATSTKREIQLVTPRSTSALTPSHLQLHGDGAQGADIAFNPINLAPMRIGGTHAGDTVRLPGTEEGRHAAYGFAGEDVLSAPLGGRLTGGADNDVLIGSATAYASLSAGLGDDIVIGGHSNTLFAGSGDDTLIALGERNLMIGGPGSDRFVLVDVGHHPARRGANVVSDFETGVDKLVIAGDVASDQTPILTNSFDGAQVMFAGEHLATLLGVAVDELDPATDLVTQSSSVVAPLMHTISDVAKLQADLA